MLLVCGFTCLNISGLFINDPHKNGAFFSVFLSGREEMGEMAGVVSFLLSYDPISRTVGDRRVGGGGGRRFACDDKYPKRKKWQKKESSDIQKARSSGGLCF